MICVAMLCWVVSHSATAQETELPQPEKKTEEPAKKPVTVPFHLKPYRVLISVAFGDTPRISESYRREVLRDIESAVERTTGQMWSAKVEENRLLLPAGVTTLKRLTFDDVRKQLNIETITPSEEKTSKRRSSSSRQGTPLFRESPYDKVFLITVESSGARYVLAGREWDEATRQIGLTEVEESFDRRTVAETAFGLIQKSFHPVLEIDRASSDSVELWLRAGAFPAVDPDAAQLQKGTLIAPFYRYLNKEKVVRRIQYVPWTYLRVEEIDGGYVKCSIISGLRLPLGTLGRRRTDVMGLVLKPQVDSTQLKMVLRSNPNKPLVGYRVTVESKLFAEDEPKSEPLELITDRRGQLRLQHDPEHPMLWLFIHSGKALLARLPFATGVKSEETFLLPDDSLRLSVEGDLLLLQGKLIDTVARRATHMARAKLLAEKKQWEEADKIFTQIYALPAIKEFQTQLNTIQQPALQKAQKSRNRLAENKINKMCSNMSDLIDRYLDPTSIATFREELNASRSGN